MFAGLSASRRNSRNSRNSSFFAWFCEERRRTAFLALPRPGPSGERVRVLRTKISFVLGPLSCVGGEKTHRPPILFVGWPFGQRVISSPGVSASGWEALVPRLSGARVQAPGRCTRFRAANRPGSIFSLALRPAGGFSPGGLGVGRGRPLPMRSETRARVLLARSGFPNSGGSGCL